jgi:hypothetical protein
VRNFSHCHVRIWNVVSHSEGRIWTEGVREYGAKNVFWPTGDKATDEWRREHNEGFNDRCCSPNIVRVIRSNRMRWAGHVARVGQRRDAFSVFAAET